MSNIYSTLNFSIVQLSSWKFWNTYYTQGTDLSTLCEIIYLTINDKYIPMTPFTIKFVKVEITQDTKKQVIA